MRNVGVTLLIRLVLAMTVLPTLALAPTRAATPNYGGRR
jgi:hypothetical protein